MTICIAALTRSGVVGMSDRMITSGDVEHEPPRPKVLWPTENVGIMVSGDYPVATSLCRQVTTLVDIHRRNLPDLRVTVAVVANAWQVVVDALRRRLSQETVLEPVGLTHASFAENPDRIDPALFQRLENALRYFPAPDVSALIAGVDDGGPALYRSAIGPVGQITTEEVTGLGYAACGSGAGHAYSSLISDLQVATATIPMTVYNVFTAKRLAERAAGVGPQTDCFYIDHLGGHGNLPERTVNRLQATYDRVQRETAELKSRLLREYHDEEMGWSADPEPADGSPS